MSIDDVTPRPPGDLAFVEVEGADVVAANQIRKSEIQRGDSGRLGVSTVATNVQQTARDRDRPEWHHVMPCVGHHTGEGEIASIGWLAENHRRCTPRSRGTSERAERTVISADGEPDGLPWTRTRTLYVPGSSTRAKPPPGPSDPLRSRSTLPPGKIPSSWRRRLGIRWRRAWARQISDANVMWASP